MAVIEVFLQLPGDSVLEGADIQGVKDNPYTSVKMTDTSLGQRYGDPRKFHRLDTVLPYFPSLSGPHRTLVLRRTNQGVRAGGHG